MAEPHSDHHDKTREKSLHEQDPEKYSGSSDSSASGDEIDGPDQEDLIRQMLQMKLHKGQTKAQEDTNKRKVMTWFFA